MTCGIKSVRCKSGTRISLWTGRERLLARLLAGRTRTSAWCCAPRSAPAPLPALVEQPWATAAAARCVPATSPCVCDSIDSGNRFGGKLIVEGRTVTSLKVAQLAVPFLHALREPERRQLPHVPQLQPALHVAGAHGQRPQRDNLRARPRGARRRLRRHDHGPSFHFTHKTV